MAPPKEQSLPHDRSDTLVVLLHAYTNTPESMSAVEDVVSSTLHGAQVIKPPLPFKRFSSVDLRQVVLTVLVLKEA
jgi:hypothetical protein